MLKMKMTKKRAVRWMNAGLVAGIALALNVSIRHHEVTMEQVPAPEYVHPATIETGVDKMLKSGECWTGGEGHPLPTRVIYNGKVRGPKMVDKTLKAIFEGADNGINPELISAYCK